MIQQDTIPLTSAGASEASGQTAGGHYARPQTPYQILSRLPKTATPWQQDSAIRANIQFEQVDWSQRPNPMRTPQTRADSVVELSPDKPMYHSRSLVQPDSVYRPEQAYYRQGVAGDPVPYTIAGDNLISSILLACFIFSAVAIAQSGNFLQRQLKHFFRTQREDSMGNAETGNELRFQFYLVLQTCLLASLVFFFYTRDILGSTFSIPQYQVIGINTGICIAYFLIKAILYSTVGWVFFDKKKNEQWHKSALFLAAIEGLVFFPVVMLLVYFDLSVESAVVIALVIMGIDKLLAFYKTYLIFFRRDGLFLQSILYFCSLEVMPLGALWSVLVWTDNYLNINF
jgi:hypothetical protein